MTGLYNQKTFDVIAQKYEGIIKSIENFCNCLEDSASVTLLMNKIYFNADKFFIENEIQNKNNPAKLKEIKKQKELFFQIMQKFFKKYEQGDRKVVYEIKNFLKEWLKSPVIDEKNLHLTNEA